jgi:steroid 5-alpha reductase family enzyme
MSLVLLPFTLAISSDLKNDYGYTYMLVSGLALWVLGFFFEAVGDAQLDNFLKHKHEHGPQIMKTGLWKYSRHPNYFGESSMWTGVALIAFGATSSLFTFVSPFLITLLLLFVSGIPVIERKREGNKEWEEYKQKTSSFIPLP